MTKIELLLICYPICPLEKKIAELGTEGGPETLWCSQQMPRVKAEES